jgi:FKBP-type peptidyl-prolyl cis-trans isomerase FkpA
MKKVTLTGLLAASILFAACSQENSENNAVEDIASPVTMPVTEQVVIDAVAVEIVPGLSMRLVQEGAGDVAQAGQMVSVHYTGWLHEADAVNARGQKFDSSVDRNQPFEFSLGAGRVIKGWDKGVVGMQIGEIRELTIAPEMAYGDRAVGGKIGPGSTLVFEVELLALSGGAETAIE